MAAVDMALLRKDALSGANSKNFLGFGQSDDADAASTPAGQKGPMGF